MKKYLFLLGSTPNLSLAELQAVFGEQNVSRFSRQAAVVQMETDPVEAIKNLGGTVKIGEILQNFDKNISDNDLQNFLNEYFLKLQQPKVHFAIGEIGRDQRESFDVIKLKQSLQEMGLKVRFNDQSRQGASAALLLHRHDLIEILMVQGENEQQQELILSRTLAVQDIDDWTLRDRGKPYADHKKGMLPPKLARMMVNLALGQSDITKEQTLYDPFCGTGTILLEAAATPNLHLIGTDLDVKAILGAKENLAWWSETYRQPVASQFFVSE
ncbi:MAG: hypothetical protein Q4G02_00020, partial [bacterium]|nr:hypothetical protein [bacterium]